MWTAGQVGAAATAELGDVPVVPLRWDSHESKEEMLNRLAKSADDGQSVAVLVPNSTETAWFQRYCSPWELWLIRGRVQTTGPRPYQGTILVVMGPDARRGRVRLWDPAGRQQRLLAQGGER